jgi:hypothetical protein
MLPLLATKTFLSNLPLLTIAKIGVIIALMGATSYLTWQVAQNDINQERLDIAEQQVIIEKERTEYWLKQISNAQSMALQAATANRNLENKITKILKDHKNAPILPSNCVIDDTGVLSLEAARNAAISTATNNSSIPVN